MSLLVPKLASAECFIMGVTKQVHSYLVVKSFLLYLIHRLSCIIYGYICGHVFILDFHWSTLTPRCRVQSFFSLYSITRPPGSIYRKTLHTALYASARSSGLLLQRAPHSSTVVISSSGVAEGLLHSSTRHTDQSQ